MIRVFSVNPFSTIDFPGHTAAVIFMQGCPWKCSYCHNPELICKEADRTLAWEDVVEMLKARREFITAVVFSGGEPTMQSRLPEAVAQVKALGFRVGAHTNGANVKVLVKALQYLDWVGIDYKAPPWMYERIAGRPNAHSLLIQSLQALRRDLTGTKVQVRTTLIPELSEEDIAYIREACQEAGFEHVVQEYVGPREAKNG